MSRREYRRPETVARITGLNNGTPSPPGNSIAGFSGEGTRQAGFGRPTDATFYTSRMTVERSELHQLVDELPDDQVSSLLVEARRRAHRRHSTTWPPAFFAFGPANDGRTDTSERIDEILAEGFGED